MLSSTFLVDDLIGCSDSWPWWSQAIYCIWEITSCFLALVQSSQSCYSSVWHSEHSSYVPFEHGPPARRRPMVLFRSASLRLGMFWGSNDRVVTSDITAKTMFFYIVCMCHVEMRVYGCLGCVSKTISLSSRMNWCGRNYQFQDNCIRCREYCFFQLPSFDTFHIHLIVSKIDYFFYLACLRSIYMFCISNIKVYNV